MILTTFHFILGLWVTVLTIPVLIVAIQVLAAIFYRAKPINWNGLRRPSIAVLMPAHNEALVIAAPIQAIMQQLQAGDRLLVVADNCSDDTAAIARGLGAQVVERQHQTLRGKGYALDFGVQHLCEHPPEVLMIVDADCIVAENAIDRLAKACWMQQAPIQALDLMESPANASLKIRIAEFAWHVKNKVRPLGSKVLGVPCQLMGTGMAFLWEDILKIDLATGNIVEDMKMGLDFARLHKPPKFMPDALVTSQFPVSAQATESQRTRWEHGHMSVIVSELPSLMWEAIKATNMQMIGMACDLLVPPITMLVMLCVITLLAYVLIAPATLIMVATVAVLLLLGAILLAWLRFGQAVISFGQLCYVPWYILSKIPLYFKFFISRQKEWIRSDRD